MENSRKHDYCPSASPYLWTDKLRENERTIFKSRCKRWDCEYCGEVNRLQHWIRIKRGIDALHNKGHIFDFVTITSHESLRTATSTYRVWQSAWKKLSTRYRRKSTEINGVQGEYVYVLETHMDGRVHVHGIFSGHISTRWWKDNCRECGLGYQAKSAKMDTTDRAVNYVSKYVAKQKGLSIDVKRFRRINYSRGFDAKDVSESSVQWNILEAKTAITTLIEDAWKDDLSVVLHGKLIEEILYE